MIQTAKEIDQYFINKYKQLKFVSIALDEGASSGEKVLDFNIETPSKILLLIQYTHIIWRGKMQMHMFQAY